jgi:ferritin-like metal-binding protein YciE
LSSFDRTIDTYGWNDRKETKEQLRRLEQCLEACGESTSSIKDTTQSMAANLQAMAHSMAGDEILKNTFANNYRSKPR